MRRLALARNWDNEANSKATALLLGERDPVFFVNEFVWTFDPREPVPFIPFDLYEDQEKALLWLRDLIDRGKDGVFEKSRDMGATWLTAAFAVWAWLFRPGATIGFGSRKLELVDKIGDPKCIFDKIRFIIRNLTPWLLKAKAPGYDPTKHDNFCKIINPANRATITGEGGDEIGRGGRTTIYFVDEAAFLPRPLLVDQALSANSRCKVYVSTPRGANNPFAVKRLSGKFPVFTLHWRSDPRKTAWCVVPLDWEGYIVGEGEFAGELEIGENILDYGLGPAPEPPEGYKVIYPWYEELKLKEDPVTVAQEYDIDYSASLEGVIVPAKWLRACVGLVLPKGLPVAGFDVAAGGSANNAYVLRRGPVIDRIDVWKEPGDPQTAAYDAAVRVLAKAEADGAAKVLFDVIGVGSGAAPAFKLARRKLSFSWTGVNVGESPTETVWPDRMKSKEKFANLKAELWWRLRVRAERTYQYVVLGIGHPPEDLLSLPPGTNTELLIAQASGVRFFETETGKIIVESKKQLADRGVASPDVAEALVLSFAPQSLTSRATRAGNSRPVSLEASAGDVKAVGLTKLPGHTLIDQKRRRGGGRSA